MTLNAVIALILRFFPPNSTDFQAKTITHPAIAEHLVYNVSGGAYRDNDRKNNVWKLLDIDFDCSAK